MTKAIYKVLSNLNFSGTVYKAGDVIEQEVAEFGYLVKEGVLKVVEGAKSVAHAIEILAKEGVVAEVKGTAKVEPQNTWGPQPDKKPEAPAPEAPKAEEKKPFVPEVGKGDQPPSPDASKADGGDDL